MATYWENSCSFGLRYVSWCKYLIVSLVFSHLGFWSGNLFLIAPFPDLCLLVLLRHQGRDTAFPAIKRCLFLLAQDILNSGCIKDVDQYRLEPRISEHNTGVHR